MAARNRVKDLQAVVNCSICLDYFNDPVILKCGHNFCRACIARYCESVDFMDISPPSYPCPLCREVFGEREFQPNWQLRNIVEIAKKIPEPRGRRACGEHKELLKLFCEVDQTPICLVCRESPTHKEHSVVPIEEAALDYQAQIQSRLEHLKRVREKIQSFKLRGENESQELLKQLQTEKQKIVSQFQQLRQFLEEQERLLLAQLEELNQEIEKRRDEYVARLSEELSSFSSLISEMEQKCQQPASGFLQDIKGTLSRCEREEFLNPVAFPSELQQRIKGLSQKTASLETRVKKIFKDQKVSSALPADFAMKCSVLPRSSPRCRLPDQRMRLACPADLVIRPTMHRYTHPYSRLPDQRETLYRTCMIWIPCNLSWLDSPANVTLDPDTAHPNLILSADRKSVRWGCTRQDLPDNPERFDTVPCVLGCEGFTSGRHYWEVEVEMEGRAHWAVGVARESVSRKGEISFTPGQGIWAVQGKEDQCQALTSSDLGTSLPLSRALCRIWVYLDYEGGQVSFFYTGNRDPIITFLLTSFAGERIRPFIRVGLGESSFPFSVQFRFTPSSSHCLPDGPCMRF